MSSQHPPLTCAQVKEILKILGFKPRPQKGTSHEHWVKKENGSFLKVTIDCPKSPFSHDLIRYMARQAGVNIKQFYAALNK